MNLFELSNLLTFSAREWFLEVSQRAGWPIVSAVSFKKDINSSAIRILIFSSNRLLKFGL